MRKNFQNLLIILFRQRKNLTDFEKPLSSCHINLVGKLKELEIFCVESRCIWGLPEKRNKENFRSEEQKNSKNSTFLSWRLHSFFSKCSINCMHIALICLLPRLASATQISANQSINFQGPHENFIELLYIWSNTNIYPQNWDIKNITFKPYTIPKII